MKRPEFVVSMSPHIHAGYSIRQMMLETVVALLPTLLAGWLFFGGAALAVVATTTLVAVFTEVLWQKILGRPIEIFDGASLVVGLMLGLILSPAVPLWLAAIGAVAAILVGKELFGGTGNHPFNSVLVGWAFVFLSYHSLMQYYPLPEPKMLFGFSGYTEYPALDTFKLQGLAAAKDIPLRDLLVGNVPGCIGTVSALAILLGGLYLIARGIIRWHIPLTFLVSVWLFAGYFGLTDPQVYPSGTFQLLAGWVMFGAFFLATQPGTCPVTVPGMLLYGIGCGCLTIIIRTWGTYIDGVGFAILLMNGLTPLLDRIRPKVIGRVEDVA